MPGLPPFLDEIPNYVVRDGNMFISAGDFQLAMPLKKFQLGMLRAEEAIAKYRAERGAVVPLPKKGKRSG